MGNLTSFLQKAFLQNCPIGWECFSEKTLLNSYQEALLGYSPRADVLLLKTDGSIRLWIEFEVSRADPVANHAKFATTHMFFPWSETDIFLSMISSHVTRGRSNLAANTIWLMRRIGLQAYQTSLLPRFSPDAIFRLNHLPVNSLEQEHLPISLEIERAITVSQPMSNVAEKKLYFVANLMEVMHNVAQWNRDMMEPINHSAWGKRRITYFAYNPHTSEFAPSKFCAYISLERLGVNIDITGATMTVPLYVQIPWDEPIFDGKIARKHLENHLAMRLIKPENGSEVYRKFINWCQKFQEYVSTPTDGVFILVPPEWY